MSSGSALPAMSFHDFRRNASVSGVDFSRWKRFHSAIRQKVTRHKPQMSSKIWIVVSVFLIATRNIGLTYLFTAAYRIHLDRRCCPIHRTGPRGAFVVSFRAQGPVEPGQSAPHKSCAGLVLQRIVPPPSCLPLPVAPWAVESYDESSSGNAVGFIKKRPRNLTAPAGAEGFALHTEEPVRVILLAHASPHRPAGFTGRSCRGVRRAE